MQYWYLCKRSCDQSHDQWDLLELLIMAISQLQKHAQIEPSVFPMSILVKQGLNCRVLNETGISHWINLESPDCAVHVEWLAVYLVSLFL